jgi:hypothetical protein
VEIEEKIAFLNSLKTAELISRIGKAETALQEVLLSDAAYRSNNVGRLAAYGEDCAEVKTMLAELALTVPDTLGNVKATAATKEAWLRTQRTANLPLAEAIKTQNQVTFECENLRIQIEMVRKKLESLKGVLALRTAQVNFLGE